MIFLYDPNYPFKGLKRLFQAVYSGRESIIPVYLYKEFKV